MNVLNRLRETIDHLDAALLFLLAERSQLLTQVGIIKKRKKQNLSYSKNRLADLKKIMSAAQKRKLDMRFVHSLFNCMYQHTLKKMSSAKLLPDKYFYLEPIQHLTDLRESIYNIDIALCHTLAERFHTIKKVAFFKKQEHLPALSAKRWAELLKSKTTLAKTLNIDLRLVKDLFNLIHEESLRLQKDFIRKKV